MSNKPNDVGILMRNPIYKVCNVIDNETHVDTIIVFYGYSPEYHTKMDELRDLFVKDPTNDAFIDPRTNTPIFNAEELADIKSNGTTVEFVEYYLHIDDSIERIKLKITLAFQKRFSLDEIYLFCQLSKQYSVATVYEMLTQNSKLPLSYNGLTQFAANVRNMQIALPSPLSKEQKLYSYEDLEALNFADKDLIVDTAIGQQFIMDTACPFLVNPFNATERNALIDEDTNKKLSTSNGSLLFNVGPILNNTVYLCLAQNVIEKKTKTLTDEYLIKIYYPLLFNKKIGTGDDLESQQQQLIQDTTASLTPDNLKVFESVDLFYNLFLHSTSSSLDYRAFGISAVKITIHQTNKINFPLDVIFKILHASQQYPLIKCNIDNKQENIYRLYSNNVSTDGRKIPYLNLAAVNAVSRNLVKKTSVAVYVEYNNALNVEQTIYCTFEKNGDITIDTTFDTPMSVDDINAIFSTHVNPLINSMQPFFEQNGHHLDAFQSMDKQNVEIIHITYRTVIGITKSFKITDIIGCVSSVFNIDKDSSSTTGQIDMRFKRVSNFNKLTSQNAFIMDQFNDEDVNPNNIATMLMQNYNISNEAATKLVNDYIGEKQVELGAKKGITKKLVNPGFKTTIVINREDDELQIMIENINDVNYLYTIPIYIHSLVQIIQGKIDEFFKSETARICTGKSMENLGNNRLKDAVPVPLEPTIILTNDEDEDEPADEGLDETADEAADEETDEGEEVNVEYESEDEDTPKTLEQPKKPKPIFGLDQEEDEEEEDEDEEEEEEETPVIAKPTASLLGQPKKSGPIFGLESGEDEDEDEEDEEEEVAVKPVIKPADKPADKPLIKPLAPAITLISQSKKPKPIFGLESEGEEEEDEEDTTGGAPKKAKAKAKALEDDDEEEDDDEDEDEDEGEPSSNTIHDISKLKLKSPNYFQKRLETRDVVLFKSIKDIKNNKFNKYSRMCPSTDRRQPVVLSKRELKHAINTNPTAIPGKFNSQDKFVPDNELNNDIISYSTDPNNEYYYMCPQYWCLTKNIPLTQEQVDEGKVCGGKDKIIPRDAANPGKNTIYHFFYKKEHEDANGNYIQHHPGFHRQTTDEIKVPDPDNPGSFKITGNYSIPCCYGLVHDKTKVVPVNEDYIKGPEHYPLPSSRWGFLPLGISKMLHEANSSCNLTQTNIGSKSSQKCLLRCGVENSATQSFIACIASAAFYNDAEPIPNIRAMKDLIIKSLTLDDYIKYQNGNLVANFEKNYADFNLDDPQYNDETAFVKYVDYQGSKLYQKMAKTKEGLIRNEAQYNFLVKLVQSYLHFKEYLNDDDVYIDYTYLWDIICEKNSKIFKNGANLVILELPENDVTNNVEVVCPTNHYSSETFNEHKATIIIMMKNNMFEPIYLYSKIGGSVKVTTTFTSKNPQMSAKERALFFKIFKQIFDRCSPKTSVVYEYERPVLLDRAIARLQRLKYTILNQVLNYQGKVIGLVAESKPKPGQKPLRGFLPCYPSAPYSSIGDKPIGFVYMDDNANIWSTYEDTIEFLKSMNYSTKRRQPMKKDNLNYMHIDPKFRVIDSGVVVGILTETNQLIQISDPFLEDDIVDDGSGIENVLEDYVMSTEVDKNGDPVYLNNPDLLSVDSYTLNNPTVDNERVQYIKQVKLETNFFNIFRNSVRIFLNKNINIRQQLEKIINNKSILYNNQLDEAVRILRENLQSNDVIRFEDFEYDAILKIIQSNSSANLKFAQEKDKQKDKEKEIDPNFDGDIQKIGACSTASSDKCAAINTELCIPSNDADACTIILPKQNFITKADNEDHYYGKIADELIRYNRIKGAVFNPQSYTSFNSVGYNVNDDEILLLESLIKDYYKGLKAVNKTKYAINNARDTVQPKKMDAALKYNTVDSIDDLIAPERKLSKSCPRLSLPKITALKWQLCFPSKFEELQFGSTVFCTFDLVFYILNKQRGLVNPATNKKYSEMNEIKEILYAEYMRYISDFVGPTGPGAKEKARIFQDNILNVMNEQGKQVLAKQVQSGALSFEGLIGNAEYFLTNIDLWVLFTYFKIPAIFITKTNKKCLLETKYTRSVFVAYSGTTDGDVEPTEKFIYIMSPGPGLKKDVRPKYKIFHQNGTVAFDLHIIKEGDCKTQVMEAIQNKITIQHYLGTFEKTDPTLNKCGRATVEPRLRIKVKPQRLIKSLPSAASEATPVSGVEETKEEPVKSGNKRTSKKRRPNK